LHRAGNANICRLLNVMKHSGIAFTLETVLVSSEVSHFTPCAHAQNDILQIKYAEKTDDQSSGFGV